VNRFLRLRNHLGWNRVGTLLRAGWLEASERVSKSKWRRRTLAIWYKLKLITTRSDGQCPVSENVNGRYLEALLAEVDPKLPFAAVAG